MELGESDFASPTSHVGSKIQSRDLSVSISASVIDFTSQYLIQPSAPAETTEFSLQRAKNVTCVECYQ